MADEGKVLPDPIEIDGIRIGDDRFKIKAGLDLNRKPDSEVGYGSIARSPQKTFIDSNEKEYSIEAIASGLGSIALGPQTISDGDYSFSVGKASWARGKGSFSHSYTDFNTLDYGLHDVMHGVAIGDGAACFGISSALGTHSFAEGMGYVNVQDFDTKEGRDQSKYAHAEGKSMAANVAAHSEGYSRATGACAHSEGGSWDEYYDFQGETFATGLGSHSEGISTHASGIAAHAEGYSSYAIGDYSHAGGYWCKAEKLDAIAVGDQTISAGFQSMATGSFTRAKYHNSTTFGGSTVTKDNEQFVIGRGNIPTENRAFIIGGGKLKSQAFEGHWVPPEGVGQGDNPLIQKNILECDWDGNLWINGIFTFGEDKQTFLSSSDVELKLNDYYKKEEIEDNLLPSVTATDNGKILMVVDGQWTASTITDAEGVAY